MTTQNDNQVLLNVKLKFSKSEASGNMCGFVKRLDDSGLLVGCNEEKGKTKIVIAHKSIVSDILPHVLYHAKITPMYSKKGYVAMSVRPVQYKCKVETSYVPKAIYAVEATWGRMKLTFAPLNGDKPSNRDLPRLISILEKRVDIAAREAVIREFSDAACAILKMLENDGVMLSNYFKR